jgi:3-oxoacyl-[acyl-carrier protein] reductase
MNRPLKDKTIVVTGASSGIGQATAIAAARDGAKVVVHYHNNHAGASHTVAACREFHAQSLAVAADITVAADRERLVDTAFSWQLEPVHAWINNAGADVLTGIHRHLSFEEKLDRLWEVDVRGTLLLSKLVLARFLSLEPKGEHPCMLFVGWDQATTGMEGDAGQLFGTTKGAVMAMMQSFAQEAGSTLRVNCVAPGWIRTAWGDQASALWQERATRESLLRRWGTPEDVAETNIFLCSPSASFINGQIIPVNGGFAKRRD